MEKEPRLSATTLFEALQDKHPGHLVHTLRTALKAYGIHQRWETLRGQLETQQRITAILNGRDGKTYHIRKSTRPEPRQKTLYDALGIAPHPGTVQKTVVGNDCEETL